MKKLTLCAVALVVVAASLPTLAQERAPAAPAASAAATVRHDCGQPAVKRHDHTAERGLGVSAKSDATLPCAGDRAASAASEPAKKMLRHDHSKFHKNQ